MLNKLCFASLIATSFSLAAAAPAARPPTPPPAPSPDSPPPPVCKATGDVLLQIADRAEPSFPAQATWSTTLYANGAWQHSDVDAKGKVTRQSWGCLDKAEMATIQTSLDHATWKTEQAAATCMAISGSYIEYTLRGKVVWTQRMCQLEMLDADSAKAVTTIYKLLDDHTKPSAIETSRGKPVR